MKTKLWYTTLNFKTLSEIHRNTPAYLFLFLCSLNLDIKFNIHYYYCLVIIHLISQFLLKEKRLYVNCHLLN